MFYFIYSIAILLITSCTILDKNVALYSKDIKWDTTKEIKTKSYGKEVSTEFCNRAYLIFPTSNKNQFDVLEKLIEDNKGYNGLVNAHVKTSIFYIPLLYMSACHEVNGQLVELE